MSNHTVSVLFLQIIIVVATRAKCSMSTLGPEIGKTTEGEWSCMSLYIGSICSDVSREGCNSPRLAACTISRREIDTWYTPLWISSSWNFNCFCPSSEAPSSSWISSSCALITWACFPIRWDRLADTWLSLLISFSICCPSSYVLEAVFQWLEIHSPPGHP